MPLPANTVEDNLRQWNDQYAWPKEGDEWSELWGGADRQWKHFILPRIREFVPAETILEIAPGYGRWTQFLAAYCKHLIVVDLSPACIERCKKRFASRQNLSYFTNDGRSLDMIQNASLDFVFTFDSLVHADARTVQLYVRQLSMKLRAGRSAFIHHSNAAPYRTLLETAAWIADRKIPRVSEFVKKHTDRYWRALDMSARLMVEFSRDARMTCVSQEVFAPGVLMPIDCVSILNNRPSDQVPRARRINYCDLARASKSA